MKTIYIIASVALMSSSAQAWEERTICAHSRFYGTLSCRTIGIEDQRQARDPAQDEEHYKASHESIKKWEAFCRPSRTHDEFVVVRLAYARNGCEFGINE